MVYTLVGVAFQSHKIKRCRAKTTYTNCSISFVFNHTGSTYLLSESVAIPEYCLSFNAGCIDEQLKSLRAGFTSLIPPTMLTPFTPCELELILSGQSCIDVAFIEAHCKYHGYFSSSLQVKWLWEVVTEFNHEERSQFLLFCTSSTSLPIEGQTWEFGVQQGSHGERREGGEEEEGEEGGERGDVMAGEEVEKDHPNGQKASKEDEVSGNVVLPSARGQSLYKGHYAEFKDVHYLVCPEE